MQVVIILLLIFSDSFVIGLQPLWGYPPVVIAVWIICSALFLFIPYLRTPCVDESNVYDSEIMRGM